MVEQIIDQELTEIMDDLRRIPRRHAHGDWFAHRAAISRHLREPVDATNADPVYTCFYAPRPMREDEDNALPNHQA